MLYHYMHFYVMMQKTREIDWCPKYEVSERFGSFKLSNSNAVAVRMARLVLHWIECITRASCSMGNAALGLRVHFPILPRHPLSNTTLHLLDLNFTK